MTSAQGDRLVEHWQYLASTPDQGADRVRRAHALKAVLALCVERASAFVRKHGPGWDAQELASGACEIVWRRLSESASGKNAPLVQGSVGAIKKYVSSCVGTEARRRSNTVGGGATLSDPFDHAPEPLTIHSPTAEVRAELAMQVANLQRHFLAHVPEELGRWFHHAFGIRTGATTIESILASERSDVLGRDPDKDRDWFDANLRRKRSALLIQIDGARDVEGEMRTVLRNLVDHVMRLRERS